MVNTQPQILLAHVTRTRGRCRRPDEHRSGHCSKPLLRKGEAWGWMPRESPAASRGEKISLDFPFHRITRCPDHRITRSLYPSPSRLTRISKDLVGDIARHPILASPLSCTPEVRQRIHPPPGLFHFLLQTKHLFHSTQA